MRLTITEDDTATVGGRLVGPWAAGELEARLVVALSQGSGELTLDLREVEEIDADGLGALLDVHRRALRQGGALHMVMPDGPARAIFASSGTERFFHPVPPRPKLAAA